MPFKRMIAIAAIDPQGVLGKSGRLPWHYSEELLHFSITTCNQIIVMGYRTYLFLPKTYFNERIGIVFSRHHRYVDENNVIFVNSLEAFLALQNLPVDKDIYVIGGAEIYTLFLQANFISEMILTILNKSYEGDTFFPLSLIRDWPRQKIQENRDFTIYHYFNPKFTHEYINL